MTIAVDQCSPRPPTRPEVLVRRILVAPVPVDALPAALLAELGAELVVAAVRGRRLQRPPGPPLVVRVHDVVVGAVDLVGAGEAVAAAAVLRPEAADVHLPQVHRRLPTDDPLGHHLAHPTGAGDAVGAEAGGDEEPGDLALAEDELAVGRERLRSVDELDHVGVDERRHDLLAGLGDRREPIPVRIEERVVERRRDVAGEAPRRRVALVAPDDHPADLLAEVHEAVGVAHRRQITRHGPSRSA